MTVLALDKHATLTDEHSASSYGVPVLIDDRYEGPRAASDTLHNGTCMTGRDYVGAYYHQDQDGTWINLPPLARLFLRSP